MSEKGKIKVTSVKLPVDYRKLDRKFKCRDIRECCVIYGSLSPFMYSVAHLNIEWIMYTCLVFGKVADMGGFSNI